MSRWQWLLKRLVRRIWFRTTLFSVLGVFTALAAIWLAPFIPIEISTKIGADAVDNILGIIASSMLAVTTFSLSTMVAAYSAATSNVTPRATRLLIEDSTTQNALATFMGSFLFALVGIIALSTGLYGDQGRVIVLAVTIGVIVLIVVTLLRWIDHLSRLGRVGETTDRVEEVTRDAIKAWRQRPSFGGMKLPQAGPPSGAVKVASPIVGYVQHIDTAALAAVGERLDADLYVLVAPGAFVDPSRQLLATTSALEAEDVAELQRAFSLGSDRSFDQDPRFGFCVLSEIGQRALSPAMNDPGTAIDVIGRGVRLFALWAKPLEEEDQPPKPNQRVYLPALRVADAFDDFFSPLARDGANMLEVGIRLQKAFRSLAHLGSPDMQAAAKHHSALTLKRAEQSTLLEEDLVILRKLVADVAAT